METPSLMSAMLRSQTPPSLAGVQVRCEVQARIPYPDGQFHLCLYRNSNDTKEHMAIVFGDDIESQSLNQPRDGETEMDRLVRGAHPRSDDLPADKGTFSTPLVRIHSECFTGETVSSVRCDCGYQLAESMRLMQLEGRGVIIYLRQEGRGIGLLDKLRAYNLQDMGHDTVTANLMLAHPADARNYDVAYEMLRDLGLDQVRLLTNNPDKLQQMQSGGINVVERVPMVPRWWQQEENPSETDSLAVDSTEKPLMDSDSFSLLGGELTPVIAPQDGVGDVVYTSDGEDRFDTPRSNSSLSLGFQSKVDLSSDPLATHPDRPNDEPGLDHSSSTGSMNSSVSSLSSPSTLVWPLSPGDGVFSHLSSSKHLYNPQLRPLFPVANSRKLGGTPHPSSQNIMAEANRYLQVKVQRMGHLLDLPLSTSTSTLVSVDSPHEPAESHSLTPNAGLSVQTKNLPTGPARRTASMINGVSSQ